MPHVPFNISRLVHCIESAGSRQLIFHRICGCYSGLNWGEQGEKLCIGYGQWPLHQVFQTWLRLCSHVPFMCKRKTIYQSSHFENKKFLQIGKLTNSRDLEGRRMRIAQIYACFLLYFLLKGAAFDVPSSLSKWP